MCSRLANPKSESLSEWISVSQSGHLQYEPVARAGAVESDDVSLAFLAPIDSPAMPAPSPESVSATFAPFNLSMRTYTSPQSTQ